MSAEAAARLVVALGAPDSVSAFRLGEVQETGKGELKVNSDGLPLDRDDLWINPQLNYQWEEDTGEAHLLRPGDRVVLLSLDNQAYYLICKVVRA